MPVWELSIECAPERAPEVAQALFDAGAGGLEERTRGDRALLVVWTDDPELRERLTATVRELALEAELGELDDSWQREWMKHLGQERVSDGFVLQPLGDPTSAPPGTTLLLFDPAQAFGVGSHPTTRLAARAVERACRERAPSSLLDVGTGTGVLALIAARAGARDVIGIDVDPSAVAAATRNAELNQLAARCSFGTTPLAELGRSFELVVANVEAPVQLALAPLLARTVSPAGRLLVTGFLTERSDEIAAAIGLAVRRAEHDGEWCLLELDKPAKSC